MAKAASDKQVVLITGTSTGVGLYTAIRFAKAGYEVVATMRDTGKKKPLLEAAKAAGVKVRVDRLDVLSQKSIEGSVKRTLKRYGRIDVLVNNAGAGFLGSLEQTSDADLKRTMGINFFGVWHTTKAVFPHMRERGSGRIISVTSVGGLIGQPFNEAYCAAKFAVEGMMEGFAITPMEPAVDAGARASESRNYTVQKGDTLASIARAQYRNEQAWTLIYAANRDRLSHPSDVRAGMRLVLPPASTPIPSAAESVPASRASGTTYTVRKGETLYSIAKKMYGCTTYWTLIRDANRAKIEASGDVRAGTKLVLPPRPSGR